MNSETLVKTLILTISFMGIAIFISGMIAIFYREAIGPYVHLILPIPPTGVAAYVFVFNLFQKFEDGVTSNLGTVMIEVTRATVISAVVFLFCSVVIILLVSVVNKGSA
ncbi:MAG: hypothetical protein HN580_15360 [Deltaproteobacteria bacterium]|jgi:hypothetical protein|nr:hypothetical protein [Deltaproteobacteria bacterium]MBT4268996.1 hypothetical protein [Deltaproteobacteria bacterium]MBT4637958.1 hypothetical protein [Deltaproteobacteria bacterium]MBT6501703.1 hypothetical protein [Deltaproteobacteria bacterium]MBT6616489.1 hypothetical protein [Deltaproteobacteria bacterium]